MIFLDTSVIYTLADRRGEFHQLAPRLGKRRRLLIPEGAAPIRTRALQMLQVSYYYMTHQ